MFSRNHKKPNFGTQRVYLRDPTKRTDAYQLSKFFQALAAASSVPKFASVSSFRISEDFWGDSTDIEDEDEDCKPLEHLYTGPSRWDPDFGTLNLPPDLSLLNNVRTLEIPLVRHILPEERKMEDNLASILRSTPILENLTVFSSYTHSKHIFHVGRRDY